uniref:Uncharacterized protein n=1 Tax=Thermus caliditerrae TaxID=1330700 RepID=A0A7C5VIX7_9DEIN
MENAPSLLDCLRREAQRLVELREYPWPLPGGEDALHEATAQGARLLLQAEGEEAREYGATAMRMLLAAEEAAKEGKEERRKELLMAARTVVLVGIFETFGPPGARS